MVASVFRSRVSTPWVYALGSTGSDALRLWQRYCWWL